MSTLRVFVASATEGLAVAEVLRRTLQAELGNGAVVEPWTHKFDFSDTAIEALESVASEADFAIVVMVGEDKTTSRDAEQVSPRDNLVFELGLFIGALGRNRSIIARDPRRPMKLPSDILSMTALAFDASSEEALAVSLQNECATLARRIAKLGPRPKWLAEGRALLARNAAFVGQTEGRWWERVRHPAGSALSEFSITANPLTTGVVLEGASYGQDGEPWANWKSEMVRLYPADLRLVYLWRGRRQRAGEAERDFHGYATIDFQAGPGHEVTRRGTGCFWDVDETRPSNTVLKPFELRRIVDERQQLVMADGPAAERKALVLKVLTGW